MTVMVATGIMSPESQKASNSPHAIIEMGLAESYIASMAWGARNLISTQTRTSRGTSAPRAAPWPRRLVSSWAWRPHFFSYDRSR